MLINTQTQKRISEHQFRTAFSDTSFPVVLTDEVLADFGYATLNYPAGTEPELGKKLVDDGVEQINGKWFVKFSVAALSDVEVSELSNAALAERNQRLAETDWRFRTDMSPTQEWITYCQLLRDISFQPDFPFNIEWPKPPSKS